MSRLSQLHPRFAAALAHGRTWISQEVAHRGRWSLFAVLVALLPAARAHDPFESWASAVVRADRMDLVVTFAQSTALQLLEPAPKARAITTSNFDDLKPALEKAGLKLFVVNALRKPFPAQKVGVELTDENDVVFKLTYPRPPVGQLHFHAAYLRKLGEGYGGILEVADTSGNHLGFEQLSFEYVNFEVKVLPVTAPKKS